MGPQPGLHFFCAKIYKFHALKLKTLDYTGLKPPHEVCISENGGFSPDNIVKHKAKKTLFTFFSRLPYSLPGRLSL
jgi:hypothetical protein